MPQRSIQFISKLISKILYSRRTNHIKGKVKGQARLLRIMVHLGTNYKHNSEWIYCKQYWCFMFD